MPRRNENARTSHRGEQLKGRHSLDGIKVFAFDESEEEDEADDAAPTPASAGAPAPRLSRRTQSSRKFRLGFDA